MLLTSAVMLWFAAAMSYPADLFTGAPGGAEAAWVTPQDALLSPDDAVVRVARSGGGSQEEMQAEGDGYARLDRGRAGNFVRLGRWRPDNFVRLGRPAGPPDSSFLRLGRPADSFIRFGRDRAQNYIRFGRAKSDAFIRLGRGGGEEEDDEEVLGREARGGQPGTPRIRLRKAENTDGDLVAADGGRREGFQRARRTGGSTTFGRGKLTDSNFIRLGRSGGRAKRSPAQEVDDVEEGQGYLYPQLAADLPAYILGPELSLLPQPSGLALATNAKRDKNYIRFG